MTPPTVQSDASTILRPTEGGCVHHVLRLRDFIDLTKPRLNTMVLITTMVGFIMASAGAIDWGLLIHALIGTALSAAGASVINQYLERVPDQKMSRTRARPLPAGRIDPAEALGFGLLLCIFGITYLRLVVNPLTAGLSFLTIVIYLAIYTPLKRVSSINTLVGAIPGAIPPMMGVTAAVGAITAEAWALFLILFIWQMPHFLAIAILYRDDYAAGGFKMLPVVDPDLVSTGRQIVLYGMAMVPVSLLPFWIGSAGGLYPLLATLLGAGFLWCGVRCARSGKRRDALGLFFASILYLPLLLGVMMACKQ